mmetsp:Transcript_24792/g.38334  ORF Transcript_24792/g.38334 Transcript_24792/m.38334 type:complete len:111 (+) Transcript_24792:1897-2229(+)
MVVDTEAHRVVVVDPMKGIREFDFDNVFDDSATQEQVYESSTRRLVCDFINGFNGTCFVYGQTGKPLMGIYLKCARQSLSSFLKPAYLVFNRERQDIYHVWSKQGQKHQG